MKLREYRIAFFVIMLAPCLASVVRAAAQKPIDMQSEVIKQSRWRSIGPATMGGRVADIAVDPKSPYTFYVALATGGLIKTANDGNSWSFVFEHEPVASVGTVAVAATDSKLVWVGTGEANGRNSSAWGNGVYKSTDSGATWKNMGLEQTQEIGRILIDPKDANTVWVAAAGRLWGPNRERGVYKTTDGGKTWKQSLAINADTGAIDIALGPAGSGTVYAAMYRRRRSAWGFEGLSADSGIYRTRDNGATWSKLSKGLPDGPIGRIGLSVSQSKPSTVYAVIESQAGGSTNLFEDNTLHGGTFRSDDGGDTWKRQSGVAPRGFYFGQIRVDPTNADHIFVLGFGLSVSDDGGKKFRNDASEGVHSDLHALWIDPAHPEHLMLGTDGGLYVSHDSAKSWDHINNFAAGEFYEIATDNQSPYEVYGGLQDNGAWVGPSAMHGPSGPANWDWTLLTGGDGFYAVPDPTDPQIVYSESQGGDVERIDRTTHIDRAMHPDAAEGTPAFRFNWDSPIAVSHFDHDVVYIGGNQLFRFSHQGREWTVISPDLSKDIGARITTAGSGAETYGTIVSIAESPIAKGTIWVGTDDGNVQLTQDGGKSWKNVGTGLPHRVQEFWVGRVEASRFEPGRAFVALDGHRSNDYGVYAYATDDFGKSWRSIGGDLPANGPVHVVREDPVSPDELFAGTEFGAFVSFDSGEKWHKLESSLPTVAVDDLTVQSRDHALVAATHGRSIWIIDNIAPLEAATPANLEKAIYLCPLAPGVEYLPSGGGWFGSGREYHGENLGAGVDIAFWMKSLADEAPSVSITDAQGKSVAHLTGERFPGVQHLRWDMRVGDGGGRRFQQGSNDQPLFVKPGEYTVTLTVGKEKATQKVTVSGPAALWTAPPS